MTVRPAEDPDWFFDLVGDESRPRHVALRLPPVATSRPAFVWLMLAVPLLAPAQLVAQGLLHVALPGWLVLAEVAAALAALALADARSLVEQGVSAPSRWSALVPPLYLRLRGRTARHPVALLAWGLVASTGLVAATLIGPTGPAPVSSAQVEDHLLQRVLDQQVPLDPATATVRCPEFARVWVHAAVECTGTDGTTRMTFRVTPLDRAGHLGWEVRPA